MAEIEINQLPIISDIVENKKETKVKKERKRKPYVPITPEIKNKYNVEYYKKHKETFSEKYNLYKDLKNTATIQTINLLNEQELKEILYELNNKHSNLLINTPIFKDKFKNNLRFESTKSKESEDNSGSE
jgi:hypothetical protein